MNLLDARQNYFLLTDSRVDGSHGGQGFTGIAVSHVARIREARDGGSWGATFSVHAGKYAIHDGLV